MASESSIKSVRTDIKNIVNANVSNGPTFVRLAFHVLASYQPSSNTIALDFSDSKNGGLKKATEILESVKQKHQWISGECFLSFFIISYCQTRNEP